MQVVEWCLLDRDRDRGQWSVVSGQWWNRLLVIGCGSTY